MPTKGCPDNDQPNHGGRTERNYPPDYYGTDKGASINYGYITALAGSAPAHASARSSAHLSLVHRTLAQITDPADVQPTTV
jgi:hypothetical protein